MRNKIIYIAILSMGLMATSCDDSFLTEKKMWGSYDEQIFTNETQTGWYIDKVYYDFFNGYNSPGKMIVGRWEDRTNLTEEKGGISDLINPQKEKISADDGDSYYGNKLQDKVENNPYTRIRNCTYIIDNIDEKGTKISDDFKKTAKGQMLFLRALQYYDLMRVYGGVPIVTSVEDASATNDALKIPRASVEECVKQIVKDFSDAASLLPDQWDAGNYGRWTRAAALAMKSRVLLSFASPLYNKDWDNENNTRWEEALQAGLEAEKELSSAGYGLYGKGGKQWAEMFLVDNSFCKEVIMVNLMSPATATAQNSGWENSVRLKSQAGGGGLKAPQEMVDLFPMADGTRPSTANGYDAKTFFLNRDPRFYRTFAFSGCEWGYVDAKNSNAANDVVWAYRYKHQGEKNPATIEKKYSNENDVNCPAFVRKMSSPKAGTNGAFKYSGVDVIYYRYAELLLNVAECYAAKGDEGNCAKYIGMIRDRAGIEKSSNNYGLGLFADKYAALEACLYERRVEFAYEGIRAWDMQRWMLYDDSYQTCSRLKVTPLNGTSRTGYYLQAKGIGATKADPLLTARENVRVNPDATDFEEKLEELALFYNNNFDWIALTDQEETPLDNVSNKAVEILWRPQYYVMGLTRTVLTANPWLEQTKGWLDLNGSDGSFEFR